MKANEFNERMTEVSQDALLRGAVFKQSIEANRALSINDYSEMMKYVNDSIAFWIANLRWLRMMRIL